jgi:hypothetical protein
LKLEETAMGRTACGWRILVGTSLVLAVVWADPVTGRQGTASGGKDDKSKVKKVEKAPAAKPTPPPSPQTQGFELVRADLEEVRQTLAKIYSSRGVAQAPRLAVDARTRTLFARAVPKDLEVIADIVAVLDNPADKALPEGKSARLVRLSHVKAPDVIQILNGLGLQAQTIVLPKMNALLLLGSESDTKETRVVIEKMDVEKAATVKPIKTIKPKGR